ncbi:nuclear transport factor 2 family protein [Aestuariibaculum suncheonense]|uniref:Nuclear transport factor 2 family protein n=1 Tax=Aestuariibaculum suncheonense TaxID=1028745 RepID=A0A8J6QV54_9FLAO|nr:nuclear transport factor 2 family protein [Aestuariibaculum suncheonense]MBD0835704.1 nuclear transport factor 2 family protein [Aestuariibaculum suncheonense]
MKKLAIICMLIPSFIMYSQTKKNGTIYIEHPAIKVVEDMTQAFVKGDTVKVASYLADDFKAYNGMSNNPDDKGVDKHQYLKQVAFWKDNVSYLSIERAKGAYPDALEYKESGLWVQTWDYLKGVHDKTGVKLNMQLHRLFVINDDNKIKTVITYDDGTVFDAIGQARDVRTNGTIYNEHEYINKVRRMIGALEHGDIEKGFSYFAENARFSNLDMPDGETNGLEDEKSHFKAFLTAWTIDAIDVVGYPDYLEYEIWGGKVVQSWWKLRLTRKSDDKKFTVPLMFTHNFNDEGMITRERGYYTTSTLKD